MESLHEIKNLVYHTVKDLFCSGVSCKSLDPFSFSYLVNLVYLKCECNEIKSLEPISHLKNLETLMARSNKIKSLTPLCDVIKLKKIDCDHNFISNLYMELKF